MLSKEHLDFRLTTIAGILVGQLEGTCCMSEPKQFEGRHGDRIRELVDEDIFVCSECGWWCSNSEMDDEIDLGPRCLECAEDQS